MGKYAPLTKSLDIDESLMLVELSRQYTDVAEWQEEALFRLPQASRARRTEIISAVRNKFLTIENDTFVETPLVVLLSSGTLEARVKRDLLFAQYLRTTPIVWDAIHKLVLPHAEANSGSVDMKSDREIGIESFAEFVEECVNSSSESSIRKTRKMITGHLLKFGILESESETGKMFHKRYFAHFYDPAPEAFWFSLALEFSEHNWTSRSLDFIITKSWTRTAYCTSTAYARYVMEEAERQGIVITEFFGSERQMTLRGPDSIDRIVEVIRYG